MSSHDPETTLGGQQREFPTTDWSKILHLHDQNHPEYAPILNRLIERYWKPVYHYVRTLHAVSIEDAKDLTQQFFTMLLSGHRLEALSPERGSFRGFLKTALKNFLVSAHRSRQARLPKDGARLFHFDEAEHEWDEAARFLPGRTPDEAFDQEWAREVLTEAATRLEHILSGEDKAVYFELFCRYYMEPAGLVYRAGMTSHGEIMPQGPPSYKDLAARYMLKEDDVGNYLRYARRRARVIIRDLLKKYVGPGQDIENELNFIFSL